MKVFLKKFKIYFVLLLVLKTSQLAAQTYENANYLDLQTLSFVSIAKDDNFLNEDDYVEFIKNHIFDQPEFKFASAIQNEKKLLLRSANRERFPTISGRIINDEVLDRKINDFNSIRKRQDDSFDAVAEINQALYSGGRINSQIRYARYEASNSMIERNLTSIVIQIINLVII